MNVPTRRSQTAASDKKTTRIQREKRAVIFEAALQTFSEHGLRGSTLDQIASASGLSKPNLLYYFDSKDAIYQELLESLLDDWLAPLHELDASGDPIETLLDYIRRKLEMSREMPRESRLFANEIVQGAPRVHDILANDLKDLVDEKTALIQGWIDAGKIAPMHPYHLIFSIWAQTQHYADFDVQVRAIMGQADPFETAPDFVEMMYRRLLTP